MVYYSTQNGQSPVFIIEFLGWALEHQGGIKNGAIYSDAVHLPASSAIDY